MGNLKLKRGFQWDLARQIERPDFLIKWIPRYADWGFEQLYLCLENAYDYPSVPGIGRKRALTPRQMGALVDTATRHNIQVVPIVPLLGHTSYLMNVDRLRYLSELQDESGNPLNSAQICPLHEDTPALVKKLLKDVSAFCTAGIAHVSLDESFDIGKCPKCRREIKKIGLAAHFGKYIQCLHDVCRKLNLRMGMWADMLYYIPEAIPLIPKDVVLYDWYYYPFKRLPKVELYNFTEVDLTRTLRQAGLDVYGCPNNGPIFIETLPPFLDRLRNIVGWWDYCHRKDSQGMLITSWSPTRAPIELNFIVDAAAASLWLDPGVRDLRKMLELGLDRVYGRGSRRYAMLIAAIEKYQLSGYYRGQAHSNWTGLASFEKVAPWRKEEKYFHTLAARAKKQGAPPVLRESLVIRRYLAERDRFIREGSHLLANARRATSRGKLTAMQYDLQAIDKSCAALKRSAKQALKVTQTLWNRSRYADDFNPNEKTFKDDLQRIVKLQVFIKNALRKPQCVHESSPLLGRWQLLFWVRNFAPALQGVVVEAPKPDGSWQIVHRLWPMEFSADAGVAKANFLRRHSVALDWDGTAPLRLRVAVRGLGQLEIYGLQAFNGVQAVTPMEIRHGDGPITNLKRLTHARRPGTVFGIPVPQKGFPSIDWSANQSWVEVGWTPQVPYSSEHFNARAHLHPALSSSTSEIL